MNKLIAIACVVSWSGFWAFGYLALTADGLESGQVVVSAILAFLGMLSGVFAYMRLSRDLPMNYNRATHG